jgi:D-galacturonate reductase
MPQIAQQPLKITVVGSGMIVHDQILPSLYHLQRLGIVEDIHIVATSSTRIRELGQPRFEQAFPGQSFIGHPAAATDPEDCDPERYRTIVARMPPRNMVLIATPDPLHGAMITFALEQDQHVLSVKPLVQTYADAVAIDAMAFDRGLFVGIEYHKRFDRRALDARRLYQMGKFGQFRVGEAKMIEPWYYRHSNFQNWFTCENTDPFTYVGCHYVDQVFFITGLRPVEVSVRGVRGTFPNGNEGYLWSAGHVKFENGGLLSVINGLGYPDQGAGTNDQGITLYGEADDCGTILKHNDQFRGVSHAYADSQERAQFRYISPDYFRLVPWTGAGLKPVGYGYESIEALVLAAVHVNQAEGPHVSDPAEAVDRRREAIRRIDEHGILATPANSYINELVTEAARRSIGNNGKGVRIRYEPEPAVEE